jgi:hypothetical protein
MVSIDDHRVRLIDTVYVVEDSIILTFGGEKVDTLEEIETKNENDDGY